MKSKQKLYTDPKTPPPVGADIYIKTSMYIDHGEDDFSGGLCKVVKVTHQYGQYQVEVEENPGWSYGWEYCSEVQEKLAKEYGSKRGYADPDYNDYGRNEGWRS